MARGSRKTAKSGPVQAIPQPIQGSTPLPVSTQTAADRVSAAGDERTKLPNSEREAGEVLNSDVLANHFRFCDEYSDVIQLLYEAPYGLSEPELLASITQLSDQPPPEQVVERMVHEAIISRAFSKQARYSLTFSLRKVLDQPTGMNTHGLEQIREVALEFYRGDKTALEQFLNRPHLMLEDRTPLAVALHDEGGARRVMKVLEGASRVAR